MTAPILFFDTETTGLHPERDEIWEFGGFLRDDPGGLPDKVIHGFVEHSPVLCQGLPEPFLSDHRARFPIDCTTGNPVNPGYVLPRAAAARHLIGEVRTSDRPLVLVWSVPSFDAERLARLIRSTLGPFHPLPWHYRVVDVNDLAVGYLQALLDVDEEHGPHMPAVDRLSAEVVAFWREAITMPWDSETLSRAVGVDPDDYTRHTALGDAAWTVRMYDAVMGRGHL